MLADREPSKALKEGMLMARTFRVVMSLAVIGAVAYGAYATRDLWLGSEIGRAHV